MRFVYILHEPYTERDESELSFFLNYALISAVTVGPNHSVSRPHLQVCHFRGSLKIPISLPRRGVDDR